MKGNDSKCYHTEVDENITLFSEGVLKRPNILSWKWYYDARMVLTDQINLRIKGLGWMIACTQNKLKVRANYDKWYNYSL